MTRRELREHVFRQLFTAEFYPDSEDERSEQMELYFTHVKGDDLEFPPDVLSVEEQQEILDKTRAVLSHLDQIDAVIEDTSISWTISRMNRTDLSILRLGVYELVYDDTIPSGVAINEAVLLARKFGGEDSYSFVNGILGRIQREKPGTPEETRMPEGDAGKPEESWKPEDDAVTPEETRKPEDDSGKQEEPRKPEGDAGTPEETKG